MRNLFILLTLSTILISCSSDDVDSTEPIVNSKSITDCEIIIQPETQIAICLDGTGVALPNEIITFASSLYAKNNNPSDTQFFWSIESGSMDILSVVTTVDGPIAKSITTIRFNSDYSGNGVIEVRAENITGSNGRALLNVELE